MVMICKTKSASFSKESIRKQIASEIVALMPYVKGTQQEKLHHAKKMIARLLEVRHTDIDNPNLRIGTRNFLLRQSSEIIDKPSQSYTKAPQTTSTSKDVTPPKQSEYERREEYIQRLVDHGYNTAAAVAAANIIYGPISTASGTTTVTRQTQTGQSKITTSIPKQGVMKSGSTALDGIFFGQNARGKDDSGDIQQVPSWWYSAGPGYWGQPYPSSVNSGNVMSASVAKEVMGESIADILRRKAEWREEARDARHNALVKSAASTGKPKWMQSLAIFDEVG
jgi:hypothetical protein